MGIEKLKSLKVIELFAGVGGFRLGLENLKKKGRKGFRICWSNQWEPSTKIQHASDVYVREFGLKTSKQDPFIFKKRNETHACKDIHPISLDAQKSIPDHDFLVGGFPCQDYSVAKTSNSAKGIKGKKGVLWWDIHRIIDAKKPSFVLLENVDRLLKSPSTQRGRDFAIMLASLSDLGYSAEWRVINAADYGMPQRRKRVFVMAYHKETKIQKLSSLSEEWIISKSILAKAFPSKLKNSGLMFSPEKKTIQGKLDKITRHFNKKGIGSAFMNAGFMDSRKYITFNVEAHYENKKNITLGDVLEDAEKIPEDYWIDQEDIKKWEYMKGSKREKRTTGEGYEYFYSEGAMVFPDRLDKPSRTIITGEGGKGASRFKHVVKQDGRLRRLVPEELELLNMFPKGHTRDVPDSRRAFLMGNALVVGVVEKIGKSLLGSL